MKKAIKNYLARLQENEKKGFSLVELIIVMAIMAILVGIVASQVLPYMEKSRQSKDQQQLSSLGTDIVSAIAQSPTAVASFAKTEVKDLDPNADWVKTLGQLRSSDGTTTTTPGEIETAIQNKLGSKAAKNGDSKEGIYVIFDDSTGVVTVQCGETPKTDKMKIETEKNDEN